MSALKEKVKNILAKHDIIKNKQAVRQYRKSAKYSLSFNKSTANYATVKMRIITHDLEKGFSLPNPRKGFGKEKVKELDSLVKIYENSFMGTDDQAYENALNILHFYISRADEFEFDLSFLDVNKYISSKGYENFGFKEISPAELSELRKKEFGEFAKSRHSIRKYSEKPLKNEDVISAIKIAQSAPSACNRQAVKIFHVTGIDRCQKILDIQLGAKGFSKINDIFVIAADLSSYGAYYETNTCYIDGGLFAMNLMNAFHYNNIGSCPLLWNDESDKAEKIRELVNIPEKYEIVLLLPAGYYPKDTIKYSASVRKDLHLVYEKV